ncbi:hypothetical protein [Geomicrobium sp. JCM 19039]|uniref:hypothetical protein n=1 Tax=Geomicrobium sp. JCM 19039 TaxID=1460636 RepID=UPI00045F47FA|nr:hypothetical protein [Geomicrobium sp. JCM 19039]GAK10941.1 hypothetical protein JCM19039_600 [Geomicrobium sp. JCM 19039]
MKDQAYELRNRMQMYEGVQQSVRVAVVGPCENDIRAFEQLLEGEIERRRPPVQISFNEALPQRASVLFLFSGTDPAEITTLYEWLKKHRSELPAVCFVIVNSESDESKSKRAIQNLVNTSAAFLQLPITYIGHWSDKESVLNQCITILIQHKEDRDERPHR